MMRDKYIVATIIVLLLLAGVAFVLKQVFTPQVLQQVALDSANEKNTERQIDQTSLFKPLKPLLKPTPGGDQATASPPQSTEKPKQPTKTLQLSSKQSPITSTPKSRLLQGNQHNQVATKFTKIDYYGEVLPASALQWSCARDIKTNLLWETKLDNAGLSDAEHRFSWYDPSRETTGVRNGGDCYKIECDTHAYRQEINRLRLCGSDQWRLPTFTELETLLDREYFNPVINQEIFFNTKSTSFWSQSQLEFNPETAMQIDFFNGTSSPAPLHFKLAVRLVSE